jgi:thiol-disulfide isomerase/thioredoxin
MVMDFLTKYQASYLDAQKVFDAALADASQSGKRVFLHFGAPWCGYCHKLEAWLDKDQVKTILGKDFVEVKIDVDRMIGGKDIQAKYPGAKDAGIPWFVMLDSQGKEIVDSNGPKGNVGFPGKPDELEHFQKMLKQSAQHISDAEIQTLIDSLKPPVKSATATIAN